MSTVDQYAASTIEKYHVAADPESTSHRAADEVIPLIKQWGKQYLQDIKLSGAYAKNTAVSLSSDVDVLITLNPVPGKEIKNIFWSLFEYLSDHDLRPDSRRVSIQVQARKMKVDLIPSYRDRGGCILFNKKTGVEVHTDLT
jgi:tRNA nucleotidyltransferase (CCA-adding enzyme)